MDMKMKPEIVLVGPLMDSVMEELDRAYIIHRLYEAENVAQLIADIGLRIRAVATDGALGADRPLLERLPNLEIVSIFGVGLDAIDLDYTRARRVAVTNTPDVLTDDVADLALLLMLASARRQIVADKFVREGRWGKQVLPLAARFSGKRVGIVGLGRVGKAVAQRCLAFGCHIAFLDPYAKSDAGFVQYAALTDMAANVDFLVVTAAGGESTGKIVNRKVMNALGPEGTLINVSRGSIVDEDALVSALAEGSLGGAGLDVFAHEPHVPSALLGMDNVVLSPHRASATVETRRAMGALLLANLEAHFSGKDLISGVY